MNRAILLIAYSFPPANESGATRPYRFYRYLPEFGVSPVVVTATLQQERRLERWCREYPSAMGGWRDVDGYPLRYTSPTRVSNLLDLTYDWASVLS